MNHIRTTTCASIEAILREGMRPEKRFSKVEEWTRPEVLEHISGCDECEESFRAAKLVEAAFSPTLETRGEWEARMIKGITQRLESPDRQFRALVADILAALSDDVGFPNASGHAAPSSVTMRDKTSC